MANLYGLDAIGNAAYVKATGAGTNAGPLLLLACLAVLLSFKVEALAIKLLLST